MCVTFTHCVHHYNLGRLDLCRTFVGLTSVVSFCFGYQLRYYNYYEMSNTLHTHTHTQRKRVHYDLLKINHVNVNVFKMNLINTKLQGVVLSKRHEIPTLLHIHPFLNLTYITALAESKPYQTHLRNVKLILILCLNIRPRNG